MRAILCIGAILMISSCKRYTCECSTITSQNRADDAYQVTAQDKSEALSKCEYKHSKASIGTKKTYCVIK